MSSESPPTGTREGAFVVFKGWDIASNDIAYYPALSGKIEDLTKIAMGSKGQLVTAFTSDGYMKSCAAQDWNTWTKAEKDLYVRVEYPGWKFMQGMDSTGNNISSIPSSFQHNVAAMMTEVTNYLTFKKASLVVAFNTEGLFKNAVNKTLEKIDSTFPLDGLYIRTEFPGYDFYPQMDSLTKNIQQRKDLKGNVAALINVVHPNYDVGGFNTNGSIKADIDIPPTTASTDFTTDLQGIYVRIQWPDFLFFPNMDFVGKDLGQINNQTVKQLVTSARADNRVVAFTTDGCMKIGFGVGPADFQKRSSYAYTGLYIKTASIFDERRLDHGPSRWNGYFGERDFYVYLLVLQATAFAWARFCIQDKDARSRYLDAVKKITDEIYHDYIIQAQKQPNNTRSLWMNAAEQVHFLRSTLLLEMREKTNDLGRYISFGTNPIPQSLDAHIEKCAGELFKGRSFSDLLPDEAAKVIEATVLSAGGTNKQITQLMKPLSTFGQGCFAISTAFSMLSLLTANEWVPEMSKQFGSWSLSITAGRLGTGVSAVLGPAAAILGAIAASLAASNGQSDLAQYFLGGPTPLSATTILGEDVQKAAALNVTMLTTITNANFLVHRVYAAQLLACKADKKLLPITTKVLISMSARKDDGSGPATKPEDGGDKNETGDGTNDKPHNDEGSGDILVGVGGKDHDESENADNEGTEDIFLGVGDKTDEESKPADNEGTGDILLGVGDNNHEETGSQPDNGDGNKDILVGIPSSNSNTAVTESGATGTGNARTGNKPWDSTEAPTAESADDNGSTAGEHDTETEGKHENDHSPNNETERVEPGSPTGDKPTEGGITNPEAGGSPPGSSEPNTEPGDKPTEGGTTDPREKPSGGNETEPGNGDKPKDGDKGGVPGIDKILATFVWVKTETDFLPYNVANPKDMMDLLKWVSVHLPNESIL